MVPFGGWDMPVEYSGITAEHMAVRERAGIFDVSHMGEIEIAGKDALAAVQRISCNDASKLQVGQAQYSGLLTPDGTFVDDLLVYRLAPAHFLLVVNASHIATDYAHIAEHISARRRRRGRGRELALRAAGRAGAAGARRPADAHRRGSGRDQVLLVRARRSGERARDDLAHRIHGRGRFRDSRAARSADRVWQAVLEAGQSVDLIPCGLGARDTLRLEAGMRLHGNDIDDTTTVLEADLDGSSAGRRTISSAPTCCASRRPSGVTRKIVGFEMRDRGIARHGYDVFIGGDSATGVVTSGTQTPFLKKAIGMAYLPIAHTRRAQNSTSTSAAAAHAPRLCRCRSTSASLTWQS